MKPRLKLGALLHLFLVRSDNNPASSLTVGQTGAGMVQVNFEGMPGKLYRIQESDSLNPPNWQDVTTLTADQFGSYSFLDTVATNQGARYYRSVSTP